MTLLLFNIKKLIKELFKEKGVADRAKILKL